MVRRRTTSRIVEWEAPALQRRRIQEPIQERPQPTTSDDYNSIGVNAGEAFAEDDTAAYNEDDDDDDGEAAGDREDETEEEDDNWLDLLYDQDAMRAAEEAEQVPEQGYMADLDLEIEDASDESSSDSSSEPPSVPVPEVPFSPLSETESVQQYISDKPIHPFLMAFGLWCESSSISRSDYKRLKEVWEMGEAINGIAGAEESVKLPVKLDTLKRIVRTQLPMLRLMRKPVKVVLEKQGTLAAGEKSGRIRIDRLAWHYWYDPVDLVTKILSASKLTDKMHFGMAHYVDYPEEFWESRAWGSSSMTTSGQFARTVQGDTIIPGDIVRLTSPVEGFSKGRVLFVGLEFRSVKNRTTTEGGVLLTLQPVVTQREINDLLIDVDIDLGNREYLLLDATFETTPDYIQRVVNVEMQWEYHDDDDMAEEYDLQDQESRYFIRRIFNAETGSKSIRFTHPTRGDLEVRYYGRSIIEAFSEHPHSLSLPLILFVDDFGIFRNLYRALKGFYVTPASLDYSERKKPMNEFTLTLGPHGASFADIVHSLEPGMQQLGEGKVLNINGQGTMVKAFPIVITGDMPQAADNSGFMRHNAVVGCRACFCEQKDRGRTDYDIVAYGRYHFDTVFLREKGSRIRNTRARLQFFKSRGMRENEPAITPIAPVLDLILGRGYDIPHSEWRGIGRIIFGLLFNNILTSHGQTEFIKAMQSFPFPHHWPRIQSPLHLFSWSLSETGRAVILIPLILRCCGKSTWYKMSFFYSLLRLVRGNSPMFEMIALFRTIAVCMAETGQRLTEPINSEEAFTLFQISRRAYIVLVNAVEGMNAPMAVADDDNNDGGEGFPSLLDIAEEETTVVDYEADAGLQASSSESGIQSDADDEEGGGEQVPQRRKDKWEKLRCLPNVHVGLHLSDNVFEYAHCMNCNVLSGELSHSKWKAWADAAAPPNLMAYLFAKDNVSQSLRLGFAGSWAKAFPALADPLAMIEAYCPKLVQSFIPLSERLNDDDDGVEVAEDNDHKEVRVDVKGYDIPRRISSLLSVYKGLVLSTLPAQTPFSQLLRQAFIDYDIHNIIKFGRRDRVTWYQRVSFTPSQGRRKTFKIGDFCQVRNESYQIIQLTLAIFQGKRYLFFILLLMEAVNIEDPELTMDVYRLTDNIMVCGLPSIGFSRDYFIPAPVNNVYEGGEGFYILCPWNIDFM